MELSEVSFLKMRRKNYGETVEGCPVQNFSEWLKWMGKYFGGTVKFTRENFEKGCRITADNRERFKRLFGKCAFTFSGSHYYHGWLVDLGDGSGHCADC